MGRMEELERDLLDFGSGPLLSEMPRCTLADKGIDGPTAAHRVEEVHTPLNFAYLTATTGTSAFQNLVGVTRQELPARIGAGQRALELAGVPRGGKLLISYPPLVSVFSKQALDEYGLTVSFIQRPSRDALLVALGTVRPDAVIGESTFLRSALEDARRLGLWEDLPRGLKLIAAGAPLDPALADQAAPLDAQVHDLYGCQEFGWLCLDGVPLREDITLWDSGRKDGRLHLIVGGLPTGDCFLTGQNRLNRAGTVLTETRLRSDVDPETVIEASPAANRQTVERCARSILRIKAKIVRVSPELACSAPATRVRVILPGTEASLSLAGPEKTRLLDDLLEAQKAYQAQAKNDPVWNKPC